jgi:hypothetical protein
MSGSGWSPVPGSERVFARKNSEPSPQHGSPFAPNANTASNTGRASLRRSHPPSHPLGFLFLVAFLEIIEKILYRWQRVIRYAAPRTKESITLNVMNHPVVSLFLVLPAVAEFVDEQHVSNDRALEILSEMLGTAAEHPYVKDAIARLRDCDDELTFRATLGEESVRAMNESEKYD